MNTRPVVFLGPSLSRPCAREILDADYRPPIQSGDLDAIATPSTVVIVDGQFGPSTTLTFSEVRRAIDRKLVLWGAASTGAMIAAGLPDRMTGLGWVFEAFRDGRIRAIDDISVLYRPDTLAPLTIPIVSVMRWLERLVETGRICAATACDAVTGVRRIPLPRRDIDTIHVTLAAILGAARYDALLAASGGEIGNVKAEDAILALRSIGSGTGHPRR